MGVHICVYDAAGEDHNAWDYVRVHGDLQFAHMVNAELKLRDGRPRDFDVWRHEIRKASWPQGPERYLELVDLLESDTGAQLHISW